MNLESRICYFYPKPIVREFKTTQLQALKDF
jgi:hypothetical protein